MLPKSLSQLYHDIHDEDMKDRAIFYYLESVATTQDDHVQKRLLVELIREYVSLEKRVDGLLKNTLPETVATEIKYGGKYEPRSFDCTIFFSDIAGFTKLAERVSGEVLVEMLDSLFKRMDDLVMGFRGTKIKTIGDAYMAVFGTPVEYKDHAARAVKTGIAFLKLVDDFNGRNQTDIQIRIGIHTGRVMAGVVGKERMQFDVFGDNVNIASRFESSGEKGQVNVSHETYMRTKCFFAFKERGEITLKNKEDMKAYFVTGEL
jgi:class 3 adenylate cyclase